jgi:hypothetical protein
VDAFIERLITRKKDLKDILIITGSIIAGIVLLAVSGMIPIVNQFAPVLLVVLVFLLYFLIIYRNIEFEYSFVTGTLDIIRIAAQRKRKKVFTAECRDFTIVAKKESQYHSNEERNAQKKLDYSSSPSAPGVYFISLSINGIKTIVYFEPDQRMLDALKVYIRQKIMD